MPDPEREADGGYCGDFLSFVMQRAPENSVWFTVMTNVNVAAVASLTGVAAVVVCESSKCDAQLVERIKKKDINVACTSAYMPEPHEDTHTLVINYCGVYAERIEETIARIWEAVSVK